MRVLIDTDVVLDFLLARKPFEQEARAIFQAVARQLLEGYVAAITPVNVYYVSRKIVGNSSARQLIADLLRLTQVCSVDAAVLRAAQASTLTDFEDAVQVEAAVALGLDAIVTRNGDDYAGAALPVYSPAELLSLLPS